ncbi:MAG: heme-binding domain-containing protein [Bacteroidetes bacterium]|nr:heme-binding domain-containing protein [Bacteroidota bacterium]
MKNLFLVFTISAISLTILSFTIKNNSKVLSGNTDVTVYEVPADVQEIIDNSCYGCHNTDSESTKSKMKLNFDDMSNLKQGKLVGKLHRIYNAVNDGDMPLKKFIDKYPDKKLSDSDTEKLKSWANDLMNKNGGL